MRGVTVILHRAAVAGKDRYQDDQHEYTPQDVDGVVFAPGSTSETAVGGEQVIANAVCYFPGDAPIPAALDRIEYPPGSMYEVTGQPATFTSPAGPAGSGPSITTVHLKAISGAQRGR